ncbi:MAG: hypothetical protein M1837_003495 [Sclerophora amabilis]|nr:MAG: hypothetical protein M1837_003495 [Sclerophora amabilis]
MRFSSFSVLFALDAALAFPWVANMPGVDSSAMDAAHRHKRQSDTCPFNANHPGAARYNDAFPYTGARNGLPGNAKGGIKVPADGDTAHQFEAPGPNDIRGPCPGLNTAANHHFLSHDGITTFNELMDAQQNLYNVGYDLALLLATLGVALDGDIVTTKMSLGCDATSRTSLLGIGLLGRETGLNGHNKFESDTSLTRNDFFLANGDDYTFNGTLFGMMQDTCKGNFNRDNLAKYRYDRYQQSLADNANFYFGPKTVLLYGAASFLYELFPSRGPGGTPDLDTITSFFGAEQRPDGSWVFNGREKIPDNWYNRADSYTLADSVVEILAQYLAYPVLFGGNVGKGNFDALDFGIIKNGNLTTPDLSSTLCLLYQLAVDNVPSSLSDVLELPLRIVSFTTGKLNPVFQNFGCPLKFV